MAISIIALLIGILLPALGAARSAARSVKCAAQLKQVGLAMLSREVDRGYTSTRELGSAGGTLPWAVPLVREDYLSDALPAYTCPDSSPNPGPTGTTVFVAGQLYGANLFDSPVEAHPADGLDRLTVQVSFRVTTCGIYGLPINVQQVPDPRCRVARGGA